MQYDASKFHGIFDERVGLTRQTAHLRRDEPVCLAGVCRRLQHRPHNARTLLPLPISISVIDCWSGRAGVAPRLSLEDLQEHDLLSRTKHHHLAQMPKLSALENLTGIAAGLGKPV